MITITLKVPGYIKSYLSTIHGETYKVSTRDSFGILVLNTLKKKSYYYQHAEDDKCTVDYPIVISLSTFEKYGCTITQEQMTQIYKSIDSDFRESLYITAIVNKAYFGIDYKATITKLLYTYNIDENDLSYSTIRKDFNRKKTKIASSLNLGGTF